jgi:uncharacterized protein
VAAFGAFVDVGVHQDGLVHVSALSRTFVKDPRDVVKPGDIVRVKVLDVDIPRKRISLTLRLEDETSPESSGGRGPRQREGGRSGGPREGGGREGGGRSGGPRDGGGREGGGRDGGARAGGGRDGGGRDGGARGGGSRGGGGRDAGRGGSRDSGFTGGGALADALRRAGLDKGLDALKDKGR